MSTYEISARLNSAIHTIVSKVSDGPVDMGKYEICLYFYEIIVLSAILLE